MTKITEAEYERMKGDPMYFIKKVYHPSIFTRIFWIESFYFALCLWGIHDWTVYKDHVVTHKNYDGMILTWKECERCSASKLIAINRRIANPIKYDSVRVMNRRDRIE